MTTTRIRTKRIDTTTLAVYGPRNYAGRTPIAGWVHTAPEHWVGQLALGSNPARNTRIFTDLGDAVQWVYDGRPNVNSNAHPLDCECHYCSHGVNVPNCGRCGTPLTAEDPAVTTLGPRCRRCWTT